MFTLGGVHISGVFRMREVTVCDLLVSVSGCGCFISESVRSADDLTAISQCLVAVNRPSAKFSNEMCKDDLTPFSSSILMFYIYINPYAAAG